MADHTLDLPRRRVLAMVFLTTGMRTTRLKPRTAMGVQARDSSRRRGDTGLYSSLPPLAVFGWLRRLRPYVHRLSAMFLIGASVYLGYYWAVQAGLVS